MTEPTRDSTQVRRFCPMCEIQVVSSANQCPNCSGPLMAGDPDDLTGKVIDGRYTVVQRLGKGGMGVVYRARQRFLDRDVALKVLRPEFAMDTMAVRRFLQEAKAASGLKNPHTVTIFEFGSTAEGTLYFTMELLSGRSLRDVIEQEGRLSPERVVEIGAQVCESLAEAHEQGIWHRDLKPDNIFLIDTPQQQDYVKVLDFGIAKVSTQQTQLTSTGAICGTPQYMSPEQAKGIGLDGRSDLYSLGVVLYEALCGCAPFDALTPIQMLMAHITQPAPFPRERRPGLQISTAVEEVVMWALGKEPEHRPGSAKEYAAALRRAATHPSVTQVRPVTSPTVQAQRVVLDTLAGTAVPPPAAVPPVVEAGRRAEGLPRPQTPISTDTQQADALAATAFRTHVPMDQDDEPPEYRRPWLRWGIIGIVAMAIATVVLVWRPWENSPSPSSSAESTNLGAAAAQPDPQAPAAETQSPAAPPAEVGPAGRSPEVQGEEPKGTAGLPGAAQPSAAPASAGPAADAARPATNPNGPSPGTGAGSSAQTGGATLGLPKPLAVEIRVPSTQPATGDAGATGGTQPAVGKETVPAGTGTGEKGKTTGLEAGNAGSKTGNGTKGTETKGQGKKGTKGTETKGSGEKQEKTPPKGGDDDDFVPVRGPANGGTGDDDFVPIKK